MLLNNLNPSIKALTIVLCILLLSIFFDPVTPLICLFFTTALTFLIGKVSIKKWLILFSPFLFMAFVYIWSSLLFPRVSLGGDIIWQWSFISITEESLLRSLSLGLRMLSFASLSLMFALTTSPDHLLLSLMQQCKLHPKIAYSIMAGYQFLPLVKEEFEIIRCAHQVRGAGKKQTIAGKLKQIKMYIIPLLATGIRRAERTATAMEAKGFTGSRERDFFKVISISKNDWLFLVLLFSVVCGSAFISYLLGFLEFYNGEL
jgi:energy-coupling factor transport system permease protein